MELGLKNKSVVVTGGSAGIGYATARQFLLEGAKVTITARGRERLDDAVKELSFLGDVQGIVADGTCEKDVKHVAEQAVSRYGGIDVWVNNVGTNKSRAGEIYTEDEMDYLIAACYKSALFGCQFAFQSMKEKGGSIVNVSSLAARCGTTGRSTIYASLKAALVNLSSMLAGEYVAYGIRVNSVMPGYTKTPLVEKGFTKEALERLLQQNLLRRMAESDEIAKPIVFLASEAASYITASALEVSGGHCKVLNPEYSYESRGEIHDLFR